MVPQDQDSLMVITWQAIGVICGLLTLVVTVVGKVLQNSIKSAISDSTAALEHKIDQKFLSKDAVNGELKILDYRIKMLEEGKVPH